MSALLRRLRMRSDCKRHVSHRYLPLYTILCKGEVLRGMCTQVHGMSSTDKHRVLPGPVDIVLISPDRKTLDILRLITELHYVHVCRGSQSRQARVRNCRLLISRLLFRRNAN